MLSYRCSRCPEKVLPPLLRTPRGIVKRCHPEACTSQLVSEEYNLRTHIPQHYSVDAFQQGREYKPETAASQSAPSKPFQIKLNLPYSHGGRQCMACNIPRGAGPRPGSNSGSRSNRNSRRPSLLSQKAARSAADTLDRICKQLPSATETISVEPSNTSDKLTCSVQLCPCLTACQQKRQAAALCQCLCTCLDCGEPVAIYNAGSCSAPQHLPKCYPMRHHCCRLGRLPFGNVDKPEAGCDKRGCRVVADCTRISPEASPREKSVAQGQLCGANLGSSDKGDSFHEDGKTTVQWALRNVRTEAARTRRVLDGCRSQLLAREEKLNASRKSPRAAGNQSSVQCTHRVCVPKSGGESRGITPLTTTTAALKENAVAGQMNECHQRQQQQQQKQQSEMILFFQRKFEKEMQAFCRRLTNVTGSLNDKLSELVQRETQLKLTAKELLKERENSSRLRRIYFKAANKNKQLAARNTSLERALLDVELKLCRPHNVWKVLGCPAAAALRSELQRGNRFYESSTTASDSSAAQRSTAARAPAPIARKGVCNTARTSNWPGIMERGMISHEEKSSSCHVVHPPATDRRAFAAMDISSRPATKSRSIEGRFCRSLPCFLHVAEASRTSTAEGDEDKKSQYVQQRLSKTTQQELPKARGRKNPHEREDTRESKHQSGRSALLEGRGQPTAERDRHGGDLVNSRVASAKAEKTDRRQSPEGGFKKSKYSLDGIPVKPSQESEAEKSVCLTHRLCRALQERRRSAERSLPGSPSPSFAPSPRSDGSAGSYRKKNPRTPCVRSSRILSKGQLSEYHLTAGGPSAPLSPRRVVKTAAPANCLQSLPRGEKTASGTRCTSLSACVGTLAANKTELHCSKEFAASAANRNRFASPSQHPCSSAFQPASHKVREETSLQAVPFAKQPCVTESFCYDECDSPKSCEISAILRPRPTCHTSFLPNHSSGQRSQWNSLTSAAKCGDSVIHGLSSDSLTRIRRFGEAHVHHLRAMPSNAGDCPIVGDCLPIVAGTFHTHSVSPEATGRYSSETAARAPETCLLEGGAVGRIGSTLPASESSCSSTPATVLGCCATAGLIEQNQATLQAAAAASVPSTLCNSSSSLATAAGLPRDNPVLAGPTEGNSCCVSRHPHYSCHSPAAFLHAVSSSHVECTEKRDASSSSSLSSSSSTLLQPTRVGTALQGVTASDGSQSGCSSSPHQFLLGSSNESCESHNSSNADRDHLNSSSDSNSNSRCSCCCSKSSFANAGQQEVAGCTTFCAKQSNVFLPLFRRKDTRTILSEKENRKGCVCKSEQAQHIGKCMPSNTDSTCEESDSAVRGTKCCSCEHPSVLDEKRRSPHDSYTNSGNSIKMEPGTDSACFPPSSSAFLAHSSSASPFAVFPSSSSCAPGIPCSSSIPAFSSSAGASSSCESSFMRSAEERSEKIMPSCPAPSDASGKKCCHALDGCLSWYLPHPTRLRGLP